MGYFTTVGLFGILLGLFIDAKRKTIASSIGALIEINALFQGALNAGCAQNDIHYKPYMDKHLQLSN